MLGGSVAALSIWFPCGGREVDYKSWMLPLGRTALC